jgi:hypothetical protein
MVLNVPANKCLNLSDLIDGQGSRRDIELWIQLEEQVVLLRVVVLDHIVDEAVKVVPYWTLYRWNAQEVRSQPLIVAGKFSICKILPPNNRSHIPHQFK